MNITSILPDVMLLLLIALISIYKFLGLKNNKLLLFTFSAVLISSIVLLIQQFSFNSHFVFYGSLSIDPYGSFLKLFTIVTFAIVYYTVEFKFEKIDSGSIIIYSTLLFAVFISISSSNLLLTFISFEIMTLTYFVIINSESAGITVSFYRSWIISSSLMLFGIALFYGMFGSLQYGNISFYLSHNPLNKPTLTISLLMIFSGFAFKLFIFPLQSVISNIVDKISYGRANIIIITSIIAGIVSLSRFIYSAFNDAVDFNTEIIAHSLSPIFNWELFISIIFCLSILSSALILYLQKELNRIFLFIFLVNVPLTLITGSFNNYSNLTVNILSIIQAFIPYLTLMTICFLLREKYLITQLQDLKGFYKTSKLLSVILIINVLSLSGFPLTIGFISRLYIYSAITPGYSLLIILSSVISTMMIFYTLYKIIQLIFSSGTVIAKAEINRYILSILLILSAFILIFGIFTEPLIHFLNFISYIIYYL